MSEMKDKRIAIVPGSFDPITLGHIDIVKRAAKDYDTVILAIMINSQKKYMFTMQQRERIAKAALSDIPNVKVITSEGMLWQLALDVNACAIVKGYRDEKDLAYENEMAKFNLEHNPNAPTVLLRSSDNLENISSTRVREKILNGEPLDSLLPQSAIDEINKIILRRI